MPAFTNMQSNQPDKDPLPEALVNALQSALSNREADFSNNIGALLGELETVNERQFIVGGLQRSTATELLYFPSGVIRSGGELRITGNNLPVYNPASGEFSQEKPTAGLTFSGLRYLNRERDNQVIELIGKITSVPYTLNVDEEVWEESVETLKFSRLTFGDNNLKLTLSGNLTVTGQKMQVVGGQVVEPEPKVSGSLTGLQIGLKDGANQYTLGASFSLSPTGVSRINSLTISKAGDAAFGFSATKLDLFVNQDGQLSDKNGTPLGGSDIENLFRGNDLITGTRNADDLAGHAGDDRLNGGAGNDTLSGGSGKNNGDKIVGWSRNEGDKIGLSLDAFSALGGNVDEVLDSALFEAAAKATRPDTRVLYDTKKGTLLYDADGSGTGQAEVVVIVGTRLGLTAIDIVLLA